MQPIAKHRSERRDAEASTENSGPGTVVLLFPFKQVVLHETKGSGGTCNARW